MQINGTDNELFFYHMAERAESVGTTVGTVTWQKSRSFASCKGLSKLRIQVMLCYPFWFYYRILHGFKKKQIPNQWKNCF